jgi:hypothetical protein
MYIKIHIFYIKYKKIVFKDKNCTHFLLKY